MRSIALNPNDALAAINRASLLRYLGRPEEGVDWARKAKRLNPYHPNWHWAILATVLHSAGCHVEALDAYGWIATLILPCIRRGLLCRARSDGECEKT
jgi:adenylate cyclase